MTLILKAEGIVISRERREAHGIAPSAAHRNASCHASGALAENGEYNRVTLRNIDEGAH